MFKETVEVAEEVKTTTKTTTTKVTTHASKVMVKKQEATKVKKHAAKTKKPTATKAMGQMKKQAAALSLKEVSENIPEPSRWSPTPQTVRVASDCSGWCTEFWATRAVLPDHIKTIQVFASDTSPSVRTWATSNLPDTRRKDYYRTTSRKYYWDGLPTLNPPAKHPE
jgi:hypothetical protein